ncbi:MAG TPA: flagellar export protein FliJ [Gammaproteobacteria bacterium]|nr:flagellar export protein FliJ [Gammaproteobacteria bacterium]
MTANRRSSRLQPVARLAVEREQQASRLLAERRQLLEQNLRQLQELESYRKEYLQRLQEAARGGIGATRLRHYHGFVGKLSEAIARQRQVAEDAQRELDAARQAWLQSRNRVKMVDSVIVSAQSEEQRQEQRREQCETDERARRGS